MTRKIFFSKISYTRLISIVFVLIFVFLISLPSANTTVEQYSQKEKTSDDQLTQLTFIGEPSYSLKDLDENGDWDVILFNQTVNITKVGSGPLIMNSGITISGMNGSTSYVIAIPSDSNGASIVNANNTGLLTISKWLFKQSPDWFNCCDQYKITWKPVL